MMEVHYDNPQKISGIISSVFLSQFNLYIIASHRLTVRGFHLSLLSIRVYCSQSIEYKGILLSVY